MWSAESPLLFVSWSVRPESLSYITGGMPSFHHSAGSAHPVWPNAEVSLSWNSVHSIILGLPVHVTMLALSKKLPPLWQEVWNTEASSQYHILSRSQKWSLNQSKTYFHTFSLGQLSYGEFVTSAIHPVDYLEPWLGFREVVAQLGVNLLLRFLKMQCSVFKRKLAFCLRPWKYWLEILSVLWIFIKDYI